MPLRAPRGPWRTGPGSGRRGCAPPPGRPGPQCRRRAVRPHWCRPRSPTGDRRVGGVVEVHRPVDRGAHRDVRRAPAAADGACHPVLELRAREDRGAASATRPPGVDRPGHPDRRAEVVPDAVWGGPVAVGVEVQLGAAYGRDQRVRRWPGDRPGRGAAGHVARVGATEAGVQMSSVEPWSPLAASTVTPCRAALRFAERSE